jgi:methylase of polypeptide subunit release factors
LTPEASTDRAVVHARQLHQGHVDFHGLSLATAPGRVMTPRPTSEKLVDVAVAFLGNRPARVVDVGTGSGAIAIAIATDLPNVEVLGTDTNRAAVALARLNAARLSVSDRVSVCQGDLLEPVSGLVDLIVANLPYLPVSDAGQRKELANEPISAVFAPGDGLGLYRRLIAASRQQLTSQGALAIQLHRDVLTARRDELETLANEIEGLIPSENSTPLRHVTPAPTRSFASWSLHPDRLELASPGMSKRAAGARVQPDLKWARPPIGAGAELQQAGREGLSRHHPVKAPRERDTQTMETRQRSGPRESW